MYEDFLSYLSSDRQVIFIEAEAIEEKMNDFIKKYNDRYNKQIGLDSEGVCLEFILIIYRTFLIIGIKENIQIRNIVLMNFHTE